MTQPDAKYLRSIQSVRERCSLVLDQALKNALVNFEVDWAKMDAVAEYVAGLIKRDYGSDFGVIPPHGRWQHFEAGGKKRLQALALEDKYEHTKRLLDLFTVSVLVDAGAGTQWKYTESDGTVTNRSEGLAVASLDMFNAGMFSSNSEPQVDGDALQKLTVSDLARGFQAGDDANNHMEGLDGRASLLIRLGDALMNEAYFPNHRPGDILDYLIAHSEDTDKGPEVDVKLMWSVLMEGLGPIWPTTRTKIDGVSIGDAWPCAAINGGIVPFHKLTQWLCYSLIVPMKRVYGLKFVNEDVQTGLPEYRNGGIFVDLGVLTLKPEAYAQGMQTPIQGQPAFEPSSDVIIEWRACTVGMLDLLLTKVQKILNYDLSLAQLLEAGSWKAGRELSKQLRPETSDPPIQIISDGTVF